MRRGGRGGGVGAAGGGVGLSGPATALGDAAPGALHGVGGAGGGGGAAGAEGSNVAVSGAVEARHGLREDDDGSDDDDESRKPDALLDWLQDELPEVFSTEVLPWLDPIDLAMLARTGSACRAEVTASGLPCAGRGLHSFTSKLNMSNCRTSS